MFCFSRARLGVLAVLFFSTAAQAVPVLTGVAIRSTDSVGRYSAQSNLLWTSASGGSTWKLDVSSETNISNAAIWPNISYDISAGPNLVFDIRGNTIFSSDLPFSLSNSLWNSANYGIDLFFDHVWLAPSIRGFLQCDTGNSATNPCHFVGVNPLVTNNSLSATFDDQTRIELIDATWDLSSTDKISAGTLQPDRRWDRIGAFTLKVSNVNAVSEPTTYSLMLGGLAIIAGLSRRRQNAAISA